MFDFLLDLIFPRFCVGCHKIGKYFCPACLRTVRLYSPAILPRYRCPPGLDGIFVLAHYDGVIRKAILQVKYNGKFAIFSEIAALIPKRFDYNYLVPVPLSKNRLQKRGFNQAEKLATYLSFAPVLDCLKRVRDTKPQFDLKRGERLKNVQDAFALAGHSSSVIGHSLCLIDDVATTGATLSECAQVLKHAGAKKVYAICVARGG
jgi:competence protein ComFC